MENSKRMKEIIKNGNLQTFIEIIKELPIYGVYEFAVKTERDETKKFLQMMVMLESLKNDELSMLMTTVSLDLLFVMVDQKLRNDILNE